MIAHILCYKIICSITRCRNFNIVDPGFQRTMNIPVVRRRIYFRIIYIVPEKKHFCCNRVSCHLICNNPVDSILRLPSYKELMISSYKSNAFPVDWPVTILYWKVQWSLPGNAESNSCNPAGLRLWCTRHNHWLYHYQSHPYKCWENAYEPCRHIPGSHISTSYYQPLV